ncbi:hypothetical protein HY285_05495 [Candidatus Peregrinibacteria bacterium]|nr:hypothetical protein [Candidatus Peregrinibacteria bacterium]
MKDIPSIYGISRKTIRVPSQDAIGFSSFQHFQHPAVLGTAGFSGCLGLAERGNDFKAFSGSKLSQLSKLSRNGERLALLLFCGFPTVDDELHACTILPRLNWAKIAVVALRAPHANGNACSGKRRAAGAPLQNRADFALGGAPTKKSERNFGAAPEKFGGRRRPAYRRSRRFQPNTQKTR